MRRPITVVVLTVAVGLGGLLPATASTTSGAPTGPRPPTSAQQALAAARGLLAPTSPVARRAQADRRQSRAMRSGRPDASLALRTLFLAMPRLDAADRRTARTLLARPTNGASDPLGDGYTVPARKECRSHVCIHWVPTTADAPPSQSWVDDTLTLMNQVWRTEVGELGYRAPLTDGARGGDARFDVYLKDVGARGIYGYCTPERRDPDHKWLASGYCVLDNDFSRAEFGAPPRQSLQVTAAHEFFHAVQFAYDYAEDPWLMESTATWMEERVADDVNDNRQYLPYGQVGHPGQPLDEFAQQGFNQYGNWPFFEYLSSRFGVGIVKRIWTRAGAYPGSGHQYSTTAVKGALEKHGGFERVYRRFAAANLTPGSSYAEGGRWPAAPAAASWRLTRTAPRQHQQLSIDHMASKNVSVRPGAGLTDRRWRLRIEVDGPGSRTEPAAYVVSRTRHGIVDTPVRLDGDGRGRAVVGFSATRVSWTKVVLVNASTRFSCWRRTSWSCQGRARDDGQRFAVTVTAVPPGH